MRAVFYFSRVSLFWLVQLIQSSLLYGVPHSAGTPQQTAFTGRFSGGNANSFSFELSSDSSAVLKIVISSLPCGSDYPSGQHTFAVALSPGFPVTDGRFSARSISVTIFPDPGHSHELDIDGVIFDGDGDGTREQVLGGISFVSGSYRCNFRWWATAVAFDDDGDGWSDAAERRLGSDPVHFPFGKGDASTPEHRDVLVTSLYGPGPCRDFYDNDGDGLSDGNDSKCGHTIAEPLPLSSAYTGRFSNGVPGSFAFETSSDGDSIVKIVATNLPCGSDYPFGRHTFSMLLSPGIAIVADRFEARDIVVSILPDPGHSHTIDFDGALFDADGDGTLEQGIGGISFVSGTFRCNFQWWATAVAPDDDGDGWSDSAERRLGSDPIHFPFGRGSESTPEHREVPATSLYGVRTCGDFIDNDKDGKMDSEEFDGPDSDHCPDCTGALAAPSDLAAVVAPNFQAMLSWMDNSDNETGFEIERRTENESFFPIDTVAADIRTYFDVNLAANTTYTYRVRAIDSSSACAHSGYSNEASILLTTVQETSVDVPGVFELSQNYPNPFNPVTMIDYALPRPTQVQLRILNLKGEEVALLVNEKKSAGRHRAYWNAQGMASGVYWYRLRAGDFVETRKMIFLR